MASDRHPCHLMVATAISLTSRNLDVVTATAISLNSRSLDVTTATAMMEPALAMLMAMAMANEIVRCRRQ